VCSEASRERAFKEKKRSVFQGEESALGAAGGGFAWTKKVMKVFRGKGARCTTPLWKRKGTLGSFERIVTREEAWLEKKTTGGGGAEFFWGGRELLERLQATTRGRQDFSKKNDCRSGEGEAFSWIWRSHKKR